MSRRHDKRMLLYDYRRKVITIYEVRNRQTRHVETHTNDKVSVSSESMNKLKPIQSIGQVQVQCREVGQVLDGHFIKKQLKSEFNYSASTVRWQYALVFGTTKENLMRIDVYFIDNYVWVFEKLNVVTRLSGCCRHWRMAYAKEKGFDGSSHSHIRKLLAGIYYPGKELRLVWR